MENLLEKREAVLAELRGIEKWCINESEGYEKSASLSAIEALEAEHDGNRESQHALLQHARRRLAKRDAINDVLAKIRRRIDNVESGDPAQL